MVGDARRTRLALHDELLKTARIVYFRENSLQRVVQNLSALALVEARHWLLEHVRVEPRLGEAAKRTLRLSPERRDSARSLLRPHGRSTLIDQLLERGRLDLLRQPERRRRHGRRLGRHGISRRERWRQRRTLAELGEQRTRRHMATLSRVGAAENARSSARHP